MTDGLNKENLIPIGDMYYSLEDDSHELEKYLVKEVLEKKKREERFLLSPILFEFDF